MNIIGSTIKKDLDLNGLSSDKDLW